MGRLAGGEVMEILILLGVFYLVDIVLLGNKHG